MGSMCRQRDELYQVMNLKDYSTTAGMGNVRLYLLQHRVEGGWIIWGEVYNGPLCLNVKFIPKCCVLWIEVHVCTNTIIEVTWKDIPLLEPNGSNTISRISSLDFSPHLWANSGRSLHLVSCSPISDFHILFLFPCLDF